MWSSQREPSCSLILVGFFFHQTVTQLKRSSTYVTSLAVGRSTARHPTWGPTSVGTQENDPLSAAGPSVANVSPVQMSFSAIRGHTQVMMRIYFSSSDIIRRTLNDYKTSWKIYWTNQAFWICQLGFRTSIFFNYFLTFYGPNCWYWM